MSALFLMSLLGISLFLPVLSNDEIMGDQDPDDTPDPADAPDPNGPQLPTDPETPETPTAPEGEVIEGTDGADTLTGSANDTINAGAGDDLLRDTGSEGAVLNGGDGNDTFELDGQGTRLVNGDAGDDEFEMVEDTEGVTANGGEGRDNILLAGNGNIGSGGLGQDTLLATGTNTANGDEGDDTLTASDIEAGTFATLNGGGGDDVLIKDDSGSGNDIRVEMNGGNGNDTLQADLQLDDVLGSGFDTLTGGGFGDTFALQLQNDASPETVDGLITGVNVTDFAPDADVFVIDASELGRRDTDAPTRTVQGFALSEAADGAFTDVVLSILEEGTTTPIEATIRLFGVTGLEEDAVSLATS